jgi:hypothetical protein
VLVEDVVHLPEFSLRRRRLGAWAATPACSWIVLSGKVPEDEPQPIAQPLLQLL